MSKKHKEIYWITLLTVFVFMTSCGKQIPGDIIQPEKMEDILYDYHLSTGMSNGLKSSENYKKTAYINYVYQKHGVTEAEFDSSMVWYTRNSNELATIYANLSERFNKEKLHIEMFLEAREEKDFLSLPGDTVDAWPYRELYWLSSCPLNNQFVFEIKPDSNFHPKDAFLWKANYTFLTNGKVIMALNIIFDNDSVIGQHKEIMHSGMDSIYLHTDSAFSIKNINGFLYVSDETTAYTNVIINDLSLTKYHTIEDSIANILKDSLGVTLKELPTPIRKEKSFGKPISLQPQKE